MTGPRPELVDLAAATADAYADGLDIVEAGVVAKLTGHHDSAHVLRLWSRLATHNQVGAMQLVTFQAGIIASLVVELAIQTGQDPFETVAGFRRQAAAAVSLGEQRLGEEFGASP